MECCDVSNVPVPEHVTAPVGHFFELLPMGPAVTDFSPARPRKAVVPSHAHDPPTAPGFAETVLNRSLLAHAPPVFVA